MLYLSFGAKSMTFLDFLVGHLNIQVWFGDRYERYWAPCDPEVEIDCKEQGGKKVMALAAVVQGRLVIHWFPGGSSVYGQSYLKCWRRWWRRW